MITTKQAEHDDKMAELYKEEDDCNSRPCQQCADSLPEGSVYDLCESCEEKGCPHGNTWGDCGACDYAADLAFDAAREERMR